MQNIGNFVKFYLERTRVTFTVHQSTDAADIVTLGGHDEVANFKLEPVQDLAGGNVHADGVMRLDLKYIQKTCKLSSSN